MVSGSLTSVPELQSTPLAVLLGRGEGDFGPPALLPVGQARISALALADLDGDGHLDLLAPGFAVLMGLGDGGFGPPQPFLSDLVAWQSLPDLFALADFDDDGLLDYAAVDASGVRTGLGQGAGRFEPGPTLHVYQGSEHRFVSLADLDEDGHVDVIAGAVVDGFEAGIWVFAGRGDGLFGRMQKLEMNSTTRPAVGDFDGDGHLDVAGVFESAGDGALLNVALGRGDGSFQHGVVSPAPTWLPAWNVSLRPVDLDGSGPLDLVAVRGEAFSEQGLGLPALLTLTALGGGHFGRARTFGTGPVQAQTSSVETADLDGDGGVDLLLPLGAGHELAWMRRGETPIVDLGHALAGPGGVPTLGGSGVPVAEQEITLALGGAAPSATGLLVLGFDVAMLPFHGGTLVPAAEVVVPVLPQSIVTGRWPELPVAGIPLYAQTWWLGAEVAASNALGIVGQ